MNDDKARFELSEKQETEDLCSSERCNITIELHKSCVSGVRAVTLLHCQLRTVNTGHSA
jgi:hypothetical protein